MRGLRTAIGLLAALGVHTPVCAQVSRGDTLSRAQVLAVATDIMQTARYGTLVAIGPDGQPQARIVDPFLPDSDLTIWIATNPSTREVQEIRDDPQTWRPVILDGP